MEEVARALTVTDLESERFFSVLKGEPAKKWAPWGLHSRAGDGFGARVSNEKISGNLLTAPITLVPTAGMVQASDQALYVAGLEGSDVQVIRMDNNGGIVWTKSIGIPSSGNQGLFGYYRLLTFSLEHGSILARGATCDVKGNADKQKPSLTEPFFIIFLYSPVFALAVDSSDKVYVGGHLAVGISPDEDDASLAASLIKDPAAIVPPTEPEGKIEAAEETSGKILLNSTRRLGAAPGLKTGTRQAIAVGGAFVSCLNAEGKKEWTQVFGSSASVDVIRSIAAGSGSVIYAGGSVGGASPLLLEKADAASSTRHPLLLGLEKATGASSFATTPAAIEVGKDEEIVAIALDAVGGDVVFGGGQVEDAGTLYKFEGKSMVASYKMKTAKTVVALGTSRLKGGYFITVGGCVLTRVANKGTQFVEYPLELRDVGGDKKCYGDAYGVAHRGEDDDAVVLVEDEKGAPELLLYSDRLRGTIGRVTGLKGLVSDLKGLVLLSDETAVFAGSGGSGTLVAGATVKTQRGLVKTAEAAAKHRVQDLGLFVKIAAIGGSAFVIISGLLIVIIIVQYNKRTGEPA